VDCDARQLARTLMPAAAARRVAIVGGGWSGIAAAVQAVQRGHAVTLFEMAPQLGGRARGVEVDGLRLDNGQHILIGAYRETLRLMTTVGVQPDSVLHRLPLTLVDVHGHGLRLPPGPPLLSFARGVLGHRGWLLRERLGLLRAAGAWLAAGFRCPPSMTVAALTHRMPQRVRAELIDPLCVAALNTPADRASATVFLRVLRDALFSGRGGGDTLLPHRSLDALLPGPATSWLARAGVQLRLGERAQILALAAPGWRLNDAPFDAVILACTSVEAARLTRDVAPAWSSVAGGFAHEPIITVYLRCPGLRLAQPMAALPAGPDAPAQFLFDLGQLAGAGQAGAHDVFAAVISGAAPWVEAGLEATTQAVLRQLQALFAARSAADGGFTPLRTLAEKRATFACAPGLQRPAAQIAPGLLSAGDYVEGPYPSTLEGAVRAGIAAANAL
jgi:hydroxysqualene dehydroxylase